MKTVFLQRQLWNGEKILNPQDPSAALWGWFSSPGSTSTETHSGFSCFCPVDAENSGHFEVNKDEIRHYSIQEEFSCENLSLLEKPTRRKIWTHITSSLYVYTFHHFSLKFNHLFSCISALHYKWEVIPRFYEDAVRFHMAEFMKMKGSI